MKQKSNNIKQHESNYWHIPKFSILPLIGLIIFVLLAIGNYQLIDKQIIKTVFTCEKDNCNLVKRDLINIYPIFFEYVFISFSLISLIAGIKKGYKNLKSYDEVGLIAGLIAGLIFGLIGGLIVGLIAGLIVGLIVGLIAGLIVGLIFELS